MDGMLKVLPLVPFPSLVPAPLPRATPYVPPPPHEGEGGH